MEDETLTETIQMFNHKCLLKYALSAYILECYHQNRASLYFENIARNVTSRCLELDKCFLRDYS